VRPLITLTTDFGTSDPYVAAMKGVILSISSDAQVIDISHGVRPQRVLQATFVTQSAWAFFPEGAVHVAVVDPGVGTERRALALVTHRGCFVGPDNGVLSAALPDDARPSDSDGVALVSLPDGHRAFTIANSTYLREPVSATFHGRDVFAPSAAHLSIGLPPHELGEPVESVLAFPPLRARRRNDGSLEARVIHIDRFGNIVTDARAPDLPDRAIAVELAGESVPGLVRTYAEPSALVALVGSSGYLEVAQPGGSAADALAVEIGDPVLVRRR